MNSTRAYSSSVPQMLEAAERQLAQGALADGQAIARAVLDLEPDNGVACKLLAMSGVLQGQAEQALAYARRAAGLLPRDAMVFVTLGRACKLAGALHEAAQAYRQAIGLSPRLAQAHVSLGIVLRHAGDLRGAIGAYETALSIQPQMAAAHANLAHARAALVETLAGHGDASPGDVVPAAEVLDGLAQAVALEPANALLHRNHGLMLLRAGRRNEAADAFNRALGLDLSDLASCLHLGNCLRTLGALGHARSVYEKWIAINPPAVPAMRALAGVLTLLGENDQAIAWSERAMALDPDPSSFISLCSAYQQARRLPEALAAGRRAVELSGSRPESFPLMLLSMNYVVEQAQPLFDAHVQYGRALAASVAGLAGPRPRWHALAPGEKLRVGYVSGDFARHSVAYFIAALLERHDRCAFAVTCYHNLGWSDEVTAHFKGLGHAWVDCHGLPDEALLRRIRSDGIHVLVDLSGMTANSRPRVFAMGAAPVQLSYLGYPTVSGIETLDGRISDATIDAGDLPPTPHEPPLRLPRSMFCYRPDSAPEVAPPAAERKGLVTFGSFNNAAKLSDHVLGLWAKVLLRVPQSRLLLKAGSMAQRSTQDGITRLMSAQGVDPGRLSFMAQTTDKAAHLALYADVDIALDTFPYNGATTTCEALWMGVPVVSLKGVTHASRMGASILQAAGQAQWVATDEEDFVAVACRLAADGPARLSWRTGARARLCASELFDEPGFASALEDALRHAWARAGERAA